MFLTKISAALQLHQALYNLPPSHITGQLKGGERERKKRTDGGQAHL
jgi:hypothetical protein